MADHSDNGVQRLHAAIPRMMIELARLATATEKLANSIECLILAAHVADAWLSARPQDQDNRPLEPRADPARDDHDGDAR
jgi:hypothetical protein